MSSYASSSQNLYAKQYAKQYKTQEIQTASQEEILILLYEGAIRFLKIAKKAMGENQIEKCHTHLIKTQRIISEFMLTLDMDTGGDLAQNLYRLYDYLHYRLVQANIKKDMGMIDEVLGHLEQLRDTWKEAIQKAQQEKKAGEIAAGAPVAKPSQYMV